MAFRRRRAFSFVRTMPYSTWFVWFFVGVSLAMITVVMAVAAILDLLRYVLLWPTALPWWLR